MRSKLLQQHFTVNTSSGFERRIKRLLRKYKSLRIEIEDLKKSLRVNPLQGQPLGKDMYKIRLAIRSKGKGKSGSARIVTLVAVVDEVVTLLTIYDKAEIENLTNEQMRKLLE
jgi:mRNA-degrading endonuclease RelE of RelBE toxin-antitoxin system